MEGTLLWLGKRAVGAEAFKKYAYQRVWVTFSDGNLVKTAMVDAETKGAVGRRGSLDVALGEILLDVLIEGLKLNLGKRVQ